MGLGFRISDFGFWMYRRLGFGILGFGFRMYRRLVLREVVEGIVGVREQLRLERHIRNVVPKPADQREFISQNVSIC